MLKLDHIKDTHCSTCGAAIVKVEKDHRHTNGKYNEKMAFECGAVLHYSPNFNRVRSSRRCPRNPTQITIDTFFQAVEQKLITQIGRTLTNFSIPADDEHLARALESALKKIRVELQSSVGLSIMRHKS